MRQSIHELRVHQIELEMQNEELRQAQSDLDIARARYFDLYDLAPVGYCTISENGLILEANLTATTSLGTARGAATGQPLGHFVFKEDQDIFYLHCRQLFQTETPQDFDLRMVKTDGTVFWAHLEATAAQDALGASVGYVVMDDITERRRAESELQILQKLQSVGTLAGGIAHDFNNLLMGLFGSVSLAKSELAKDHPSYAPLEEAEHSMNRAVRLTKQLLTFAKGGEPVKEDVNLGALVEDVAPFDLSGSQVRLVYQQVENLWPARVDKGQIQQVISNLTINARQAMPAGGRLYITLENVEIQEDVGPSLQRGKYVEIVVRDEGSGIDPKYLGRIFDPYFTTKQTGDGLGLATVYSIVHRHGGHISVVSELGKGATFTLYLPASETSPQAESRQTATACPTLLHPTSVLLVDDQEIVRVIVTKMLTRCGYSVATAPGGREALEMYKQALANGAPFDVVIMDLTIPGGIGGKEAIKNLLAIDPQVRTIVSSGYSDDPVMTNYAEYGFKGVAPKPYTLSELQEVLTQVLKWSGRSPRNCATAAEVAAGDLPTVG